MGMLLFFSSSLMISHLGINPERGGSPPRDSRMEATSGVIIGYLFHDRDMELIVVWEDDIRIRNIEVVIRI